MIQKHHSLLLLHFCLYNLPRGHSTTTWTEFCNFLTPLPFVRTVLYPERGQKQTFLTPSPPHLVHVVIEWPLSALQQAFVIVVLPTQCQMSKEKEQKVFILKPLFLRSFISHQLLSHLNFLRPTLEFYSQRKKYP